MRLFAKFLVIAFIVFLVLAFGLVVTISIFNAILGKRKEGEIK